MKLIIQKLAIALLMIFLLKEALPAQTIAEKKAGMTGGGNTELSPELRQFLTGVNKELKEKHAQLDELQGKVLVLFRAGAPPEAYRDLLLKINETKDNISILQESWRELVSQSEQRDEYALWHQPETTIEQLISDFGSSDFVYLIDPEIGSIKVSISSNIPIPRADWGLMLEQILLQNGVGIKELNPYLRSLYQITKDLSSMKLITNNPMDLEIYPNNARVSFVLTPDPMEVRRTWFFLEKFANTSTTVLQRIGRAVLIVGEVSAIKDLLKIYNFVLTNKRELDYKAVPLFRIDAEEMAKILTTIFSEFAQAAEIEVEEGPATEMGERGRGRPRGPRPPPKAPRSKQSGDINALNVIALPKVAQAVFLIGTREEIQKAVDIITEVEGQVAGARQREVLVYHVKHSDPEDLADVLQRIYTMMIQTKPFYPNPEEALSNEENFIRTERENILRNEMLRERFYQEKGYLEPTPIRVYQQSYYQQGGYVVNPRPIEPGGPIERDFNKDRTNFIIDPKTGYLVMVVESDLIPQLKELIKKLDIPKKMVQIECLLFEKHMIRDNDYGLNLLRIGSAATQRHVTSLSFNDPLPVNLGVLQFLISRPKSKSGFPAFDLSYTFLMSQDDVHINAAPSVVAVNQTPAVIAINEEISVLTGVYQVETAGGVTLQDAFTRAQYGINISVTPTIHMANENNDHNIKNCNLGFGFGVGDVETNYVTLDTDITFDTFDTATISDQPNVTRRHITNTVSVPDGQTVIIGGLRRKNSTDSYNYIPFLGEIPYVGKLFSFSTLHEDETDMIIFLTPKIISEPVEDFYRLRAEEMRRRPGDLPCFLTKLNQALYCEQHRLFQAYMTMLFGPPGPRYTCWEGDYDGR